MTDFVEVRGRRVQETRGGAGPALLYLHGPLGEIAWLPPLSLLGERRTVHAPAHPGFLESEGYEEIRDIEDLVYHYVDYLDTKECRAVDVVGGSLGGWIAAELAARYPERVSHLVLAGAVGIWIPERPIADVFAFDPAHPARVAELLFHDREHPAARLAQGPLGANLPDALLVSLMRAMAATARVGWNPLLHDPRLEGLLHRVTAPTLCLWGEHDRVVPVEYGERYAKRIPGARLEVVPACGHLLALERPEAFARAVLAFLGES